MKKLSAGKISGCLVWVLVFFLLSSCLMPVAMAIGGITSGTDFVAKLLGPAYCSENTTPEMYSYATTSRDENGFSHPATAYELHCVDSNGEVVNTSLVSYAFLWIGILFVVSLIFSGIFAFVLAAPAGILIGRMLNKNKKDTISS
jgi:hypothetical protein